MMKRKDWVVWRRRYISHGSTHDYVNLVMSKGVDIWQRITGLCTDVAFKDLFKICSLTLCHRVAGQKFQTGVQSWLLLWLEMSLYIPVVLLFLPFPSQWSFPNQFSCSLGHTSCREMGLFAGANDAPIVKVFALHSSTNLFCYTKKLFGTNSWLTLCFTFPKRNSKVFIVSNFLQGSLPSQHVQSIPLFIRHRSECFLKLTP